MNNINDIKRKPLRFFTFSVFFVIVFIIDTLVDYNKYSSTLNSAPFSVYILDNYFWLLLAFISLLFGIYYKRKRK